MPQYDKAMQNSNSIFSFKRFFDDYPSLSMRRKEVRLKLRKLVKRASCGQLDFNDFSVRFEKYDYHHVIQAQIVEILESTACRPYTAAEVRERLDITNQERLRWTKDGRLKRKGYEIIQRGQKVSVTTYDVLAIDDLASSPETIERWRNSD